MLLTHTRSPALPQAAAPSQQGSRSAPQCLQVAPPMQTSPARQTPPAQHGPPSAPQAMVGIVHAPPRQTIVPPQSLERTQPLPAGATHWPDSQVKPTQQSPVLRHIAPPGRRQHTPSPPHRRPRSQEPLVPPQQRSPVLPHGVVEAPSGTIAPSGTKTPPSGSLRMPLSVPGPTAPSWPVPPSPPSLLPPPAQPAAAISKARASLGTSRRRCEEKSIPPIVHWAEGSPKRWGGSGERVFGPTERRPVAAIDGGAEGDRTPDLRTASATLSQLSYSPARAETAV